MDVFEFCKSLVLDAYVDFSTFLMFFIDASCRIVMYNCVFGCRVVGRNKSSTNG